jgi:hypothetical protein
MTPVSTIYEKKASAKPRYVGWLLVIAMIGGILAFFTDRDTADHVTALAESISSVARESSHAVGVFWLLSSPEEAAGSKAFHSDTNNGIGKWHYLPAAHLMIEEKRYSDTVLRIGDVPREFRIF